MNASLKKRLFQIGSFLIAGLLLYLALRGVEFGRVAEDLARADYRWIVPLVLVTLLSHWLRGWRWVQLIEALPEEQRGERVTILAAFNAVMIGYLANYVAPRVGEFVRTANIAARFKLRFSAVLGTVAVERILDVIFMGLALFTVPLLLQERLGPVQRLLVDPVMDLLGGVSLIPLLLVLLVGAGLGLWLLRRLFRPDPGGEPGRLAGIGMAFRDGILALVRTPRRGVLVVSTFGIWICYALMAYIPFQLFGMTETYGLGVMEGWSLMLLSAIGVVIPSPGGIGTYHYITIQSLMLIWAVPQSTAASYALFSHTGQLVLYVIVGAFAVIGQGMRIRTAGAPGAAVEGDPSTAPATPEDTADTATPSGTTPNNALPDEDARP